jgi:flavorubredoxin
MDRFNVEKIADGTYWVGVKDWDRRMFDALIPLPQGTSYNSYLVKGNEKIALIDTVNPGFEGEFVEKIEQVTELNSIDYLVMNHAEPDHASTIPLLMDLNDKVVLLATEKGAKMAESYFDVPPERIMAVRDGGTLDLGGKTLRFIEAPWLHWPETMFTYLVEEKILFPCDFFGSHTATGLYDDENEELYALAQRYFGEIMMPFRKMGAKGMEKVQDLDIKIIAPSHGPMHRHPERIMEHYRRWTRGETREKVIVVYVSMWSSTRDMIRSMVERLLTEGVEVVQYDLTASDIGDIAKDLVDSRGIVLGSPTVLGGLHPAAAYAATLVRALKPPLQYGVVLGSYGWGGGAVRQASEILGPTSMVVLGAIEIKGRPTMGDHETISDLGRELAAKVKGK